MQIIFKLFKYEVKINFNLKIYILNSKLNSDPKFYFIHFEIIHQHLIQKNLLEYICLNINARSIKVKIIYQLLCQFKYFFFVLLLFIALKYIFSSCYFIILY